ncbi:hypothetical protein ACFLV6_02240 [Chloroflexota bacterium]
MDGKDLSELSSKEIQNGIRKPADTSNQIGMSPEQLEKAILVIEKSLSDETVNGIEQFDTRLRAMLVEIRVDKESEKLSAKLELTQAGLKLLDDTGECPLCDTSWEPEKLKTYLEEKLVKSKGFVEKNNQAKELSSSVSQIIDETIVGIKSVVSASEKLGLQKEKTALEQWQTVLEGMSVLLNTALDKYPTPKYGPEKVKRLERPENIENILSTVRKNAASQIPEMTPELNSWTKLVQIVENIKSIEQARSIFDKSNLYYKRADGLDSSFHKARDRILGELYEEVRDRFVEL